MIEGKKEGRGEIKMSFEIEQKPIVFRFSDFINETRESESGYTLNIAFNKRYGFAIGLTTETYRKNNYVGCDRTIHGYRVTTHCHICHAYTVWLIFADEGVYNCDLEEINPEVPSICKMCTIKAKNAVSRLPVWTEEDTIKAAEDEFKERIYSQIQRNDMP